MKLGRTIFVLAPHTDDGELGCGGTISKLIAGGDDVIYIAFSNCYKQELEAEMKNATQILGIKKIILLEYPVRNFCNFRQKMLDEMIRLRDNYKPDVIFTPARHDIHQDHHTVTTEAMRAFKYSSIISYEMPWNNFSFHTNYFVPLEEEHVSKKVKAMEQYQSQAHRSYCNGDFIRSLARVRGTQINTTYAETFEIIRWIND